MSYSKVLYVLDDHGVARISMNDPATLNASSDTMCEETLDALDRASVEARAIVLTGEGRAFCSGANLAHASALLEDPRRDVGKTLDRTLNPSVVAIKAMDMRMKNWPATQVQGYIQLGNMYTTGLRDPAKAFESFKKAMDLTPEPERKALLSQIQPVHWAKLGFPNVIPVPSPVAPPATQTSAASK